MKYILGVDVGGSKTHAAVASADGTILSDINALGALYTDVGLPVVINIIKQAVSYCLINAGISLCDIAVGVFGMTGIDWPYEKVLHKEALETAFPEIGEILVFNDSLVALHAGTSKNWGAILCSGTGFNAASISPQGESFVFGYYENAPHCGGKSLGRKIIKAVCDSRAGLLPKTRLSDIVLSHFAVSSEDELLILYQNKPFMRDDLITLPAKMFSLYEENDEVAGMLTKAMIDELAHHAVAAIKNVNIQNSNPDIVLSGGMLKAAPKDTISKLSFKIKESVSEFNLFYSIYEPVVGALKIGMNHMGIEKNNIISLYSSAENHETLLRTK